MARQFKVVVERHADGYVAYPLGLKGVVVGQGETYGEALNDVSRRPFASTLKRLETKPSIRRNRSSRLS